MMPAFVVDGPLTSAGGRALHDRGGHRGRHEPPGASSFVDLLDGALDVVQVERGCSTAAYPGNVSWIGQALSRIAVEGSRPVPASAFP